MRLGIRYLVRGVVGASLCAPVALGQNWRWIQQFGTRGNDFVWAATPDLQGGIYLAGSTQGSLGGPNQGYFDAWLACIDSKGNPVWARQLGGNGNDAAEALAPDGTGGVYVTGSGDGCWLARYDAGGGQRWIRGWESPRQGGEPSAAAEDGMGGVYLGGFATAALSGSGSADAWLSRTDSTGSVLWSRQLGSTGSDFIEAATPDGTGGVYVAGYTDGAMRGSSAGAQDAWLARFDGAGTCLWLLQFGTPRGDRATACVRDGVGGLFVGGATDGMLGTQRFGTDDAWIARLDESGNVEWIDQFGSATLDTLFALVPDGVGGAWSCGETWGWMAARPSGESDVWIAHHDGTGTLLNITQFGTEVVDSAYAAAPAGLGGIYVAGSTLGSLGGLNPSYGFEAWVARFHPH